jgi:hypothetical protein
VRALGFPATFTHRAGENGVAEDADRSAEQSGKGNLPGAGTMGSATFTSTWKWSWAAASRPLTETRTPQHLAKLVAPALDGFQLVDSIPTDGQRADANCPL